MSKQVKRSPMFYVGDKYKLIQEIKSHFPSSIHTFVEPFVGGGTVSLNVEAKKYILNDIDSNVYNLHLLLQEKSQETNFFEKVLKQIKKYNLSHSFKEDILPPSLRQKYKKTYYAHFNRDGYKALKEDFNKSKKKNYLLLYLLLIFGFNRMLRFNSKGDFNVPVGNVDFNKNVFEALNHHFKFSKTQDVTYTNIDFKPCVENISLDDKDLVYLDPPYLITFSEYNKIWNEEKEHELLNFLDELHAKGIKFAISNVTHYKGRINTIFIEWMKKYTVKKIKSNYISYHDNSVKKIEEVLVFNYKVK